ncbi:DUF59 domain-containing protein [Flammeovirga pectinis]|uniref:DUF59 domain-containing protein n=1 Tax=Flammeovirga pectinis TaxID=2494373 RepID=A0A3S9P8C2_9BACT|nr:iron-sulfur cluster assembly protein [Flammeovirga pectinis]AZQ64458.1 DUF59 domain-containing protein [Flammeovirga pectinis]
MTEENKETSQPVSTEALKEKVVEAIKTVYDPEIPVDVFELGLIYDINIIPPLNKVHILMTLTTPSCPSAEQIPGEIQLAAKEVEGVTDVEIELTFEPPYTTDMMSDEAKLELGFM